jgi:hypothetical protein
MAMDRQRRVYSTSRNLVDPLGEPVQGHAGHARRSLIPAIAHPDNQRSPVHSEGRQVYCQVAIITLCVDLELKVNPV